MLDARSRSAELLSNLNTGASAVATGCPDSSLDGSRQATQDDRTLHELQTRDMKAAKPFFDSAKTITGIAPARSHLRHDSSSRATRTGLGRHVLHRTGRYLNTRLEQDH